MSDQRPKRTGPRKLQVVALSSAAIATVYALGWAATRPGAPGDEQPVRLAPGQQRPIRAGLRPPAPPGHYSDRSWTGVASNAFGEVEVAVRIQGGRIAAARLARTSTLYPASAIAALPPLPGTRPGWTPTWRSGSRCPPTPRPGTTRWSASHSTGSPASRRPA